MALTLHTIKPSKGSQTTTKRLGRGIGSARGKTSGRGMKGQGSRSGNSGSSINGLRQMLLRVPKTRGFKSHKIQPAALNLSALSKMTETLITPKTLKNAGLITDVKVGVKLMGDGEAKPSMLVRGCLVTKGARTKIEAAGGKIE
ncbi:50S ribosomal protein L15 [Candidatus Uhrbacteria bacterium CG10_big_fil_rev_8_21_14_0_10_50_16]|uniref:Large ribosomal subunit protein uL15 n=1 Tax=Candidatus Uhrbacteria bacterium CG10_big_fil_rev_8_21_14_0_10_50_16 TaxID=1975039 RepID=A0A2H0RM98_9BACT|nr:MAG: 50S ribosomal protein L15 [Candidatus Uhrbacteria bacterium CG10_big_fil_rev_8_21_14_0_10_50_16]